MDAIDVNLSRIREGLRLYQAAQRAQVASAQPAAPAPVQSAPLPAVQELPERSVPSPAPPSFPKKIERASAPHLQTAAVPDPAESSATVTDEQVHAEAPAPLSAGPSTAALDRPLAPSETVVTPISIAEVTLETIAPMQETGPDDAASARDLVVFKRSIWSRIKGFVGLR